MTSPSLDFQSRSKTARRPCCSLASPSPIRSASDRTASYFNDTEQAEELQGHVTWLRGKHSLKAGFDYTFQTFNAFRPERPSGFYDFTRAFTQGPNPVTSSSTTGYGVATFLLGVPTGGSFSFDRSLATSTAGTFRMTGSFFAA